MKTEFVIVCHDCSATYVVAQRATALDKKKWHQDKWGHKDVEIGERPRVKKIAV